MSKLIQYDLHTGEGRVIRYIDPSLQLNIESACMTRRQYLVTTCDKGYLYMWAPKQKSAFWSNTISHLAFFIAADETSVVVLTQRAVLIYDLTRGDLLQRLHTTNIHSQLVIDPNRNRFWMCEMANRLAVCNQEHGKWEITSWAFADLGLPVDMSFKCMWYDMDVAALYVVLQTRQDGAFPTQVYAVQFHAKTVSCELIREHVLLHPCEAFATMGDSWFFKSHDAIYAWPDTLLVYHASDSELFMRYQEYLFMVPKQNIFFTDKGWLGGDRIIRGMLRKCLYCDTFVLPDAEGMAEHWTWCRQKPSVAIQNQWYEKWTQVCPTLANRPDLYHLQNMGVRYHLSQPLPTTGKPVLHHLPVEVENLILSYI